MRKLLMLGLVLAPLFSVVATAHAQDQSFQTRVLQKLDALDQRLDGMDKRLNEMDKRNEVRFTAIETKLAAIDQRFDAVNQRIDDKFNLIVGVLTIIAAFLALPFIPKLFERVKAPAQNQEDFRRLEKEVAEIRTQLAQLSQTLRPTS